MVERAMSVVRVLSAVQHLRALFGLSFGALLCLGIGVANLGDDGRAAEAIPALLIGVGLLAAAAGLVWLDVARARRVSAAAKRGWLQ